jgi:hypothetical protein
MHQIQLDDRLYQQAQLRASEAGIKSVDDYIADVVASDLSEKTENLDHLFTPQRLAHIDSVVAKVKAGGKTHTAEEVQEHFRKRSES